MIHSVEDNSPALKMGLRVQLKALVKAVETDHLIPKPLGGGANRMPAFLGTGGLVLFCALRGVFRNQRPVRR